MTKKLFYYTCQYSAIGILQKLPCMVAIVGFPVPDALLCKLLRFLECMLAYFQSTRLNVQSHSLTVGMLKQCIATFHPDLMRNYVTSW